MFVLSILRLSCATPNVTKYQRCNFIIQNHQLTIKIDKININLLVECVKIVEFNVNSRVFHVMYQETRFLNQDARFLNQEGRRQFLISFVSERDWNRKICHAPWRIPPILAHSRPPALDMAEEGIEELVRRIIRSAQEGVNTSRANVASNVLDCKTVVFFFSKSVKKPVKGGVRVLRGRSVRASHTRRACEAREKKPTDRFPYNEFVPTRGFKNVVKLSKICSQPPPSLWIWYTRWE